MPAIGDRANSTPSGDGEIQGSVTAVGEKNSGDIRFAEVARPQKRKRKLRNDEAVAMEEDSAISSLRSPRKSPRRCTNGRSNSPSNEIERITSDNLTRLLSSPAKESSEWNPRDPEQMRVVKEALHVSTTPSSVVCREDEYSRVLEFCKSLVEKEKSGSLYVCGCPGTGKTMIMEKVQSQLADLSEKASVQTPDVLYINCTSLTNPTEVFRKILKKVQPQKKIKALTEALKHIQNLYSVDGKSSCKKLLKRKADIFDHFQLIKHCGIKMLLTHLIRLLIVDELDYLITKDRVVLHELFMLTTLPFSRFILIGIANAIDLADRFLPRLESLNCKPMVLTFRAYSKDQILRILQDRLMAFPYTVFQPHALELCARKVAAASGDMRKALSICRCALEILEAEVKQTAISQYLSPEDGSMDDQSDSVSYCPKQTNIVQVDHIALALSRTFGSPIVETVQSLPQHQQIFLCSTIKLFRGSKKLAAMRELNKCYEDLCKSVKIRPVGILELSSFCRVLGDQGILKVGLSHKIDRVALQVDASDITFALQGVRFFRNCLS